MTHNYLCLGDIAGPSLDDYTLVIHLDAFEDFTPDEPSALEHRIVVVVDGVAELARAGQGVVTLARDHDRTLRLGTDDGVLRGWRNEEGWQWRHDERLDHVEAKTEGRALGPRTRLDWELPLAGDGALGATRDGRLFRREGQRWHRHRRRFATITGLLGFGDRIVLATDAGLYTWERGRLRSWQPDLRALALRGGDTLLCPTRTRLVEIDATGRRRQQPWSELELPFEGDWAIRSSWCELRR